MSISYVITPFAAWLVAGTLKFIINSVRSKTFAFGLIGYGGLPSNHSAIVSSTATLIALKEGISHPAFGVAVTIAFIVMLDANSLRKQVGRQAAAINRLFSSEGLTECLRERIGHSRIEIAAGVLVGIAVASSVNTVFR
ncbi:divergent PAP2 family protein [Noviherbaspirillum massiliense]|uniref:divergent PAP2 family protein n=1 Tax=Noviherbaspirillum massiliense TaxID=1465823 RepID=UPI00094723E3|nr:divergent PAP2 family protein [Noviherbaspirillum massiliense]